MAIARHVSSKMLAHYSHVRMDAKRRALMLFRVRVQGGVMAQTTTQTLCLPLSLIRK
jgi:hypothetical protein